MELILNIYMTRMQRGTFEASIPWIAPLSEPVRGSSPAKLKEELMFRAMRLVQEEMAPADFDRLLPPSELHLLTVYFEVERPGESRRSTGSMHAWTHAIVGRWSPDQHWRVWFPKIPGEALVLEDIEDAYPVCQQWLRDHALANELTALDHLNCGLFYGFSEMPLDLELANRGGDRSSSGDDELTAARAGEGRLCQPDTLEEVATNLTHRAEDGTLPATYGGADVIAELVEALSSDQASHICLIGPSGVGKTSLVYGAAERLFQQGRSYGDRRDLWQTSGDRIISGMSVIGQWEQRTEAMCRELATRGDVLVVEDLLELVRAGRSQHGASSVARFIEPYLEQGRFSLVTEATPETWELARSIAPGFVSRFRRIQLTEPGAARTLAILTEGLRDLERNEPVRFLPDAVEAILQLCRRFYRREAFPGKAVRLAKQCFNEGVRRLHQAELDALRIDAALVAEVVNRQTGLPPSILRPGQGRTPAKVREFYEGRIFGQPDAVDVMTGLVLTLEQGLVDPRRPLGSFLLVGPSGVGKTETARALAADLFGSAERMVRFDMSEFSEPYAQTRLIGTPAHPDGELTGPVRLQPFSVLLFDEIEKAHPRVLDLLLQLLGDGRLTDAAGRTVDFCNTVVMMTSNLGASSEDRWLGFSERSHADRRLHYQRSAEQFFRPELFNRIDRVVAYRPLDSETLRRIARRTVRELLERRGLRQAQVLVDVDPRLIGVLAGQSVDRRYGARTLAHRIEQQLITPLARELTRGVADDALTRVTVLATQDEPLAIDLRVQELRRAPRFEPRFDTGARDASDAVPDTGAEHGREALHARLTAARDALTALRESAAVQAIHEEYDGLLARLNLEAQDGKLSAEIAEGLRQRDAFRDRLADLDPTLEALLERVEGLVPPASSAAGQSDKTALQRLARRVQRAEWELTWLRLQLESLRANTGQVATFVVEAVAGPCTELLARWRDWIEQLRRALDLHLHLAYRTQDGWKPGASLSDAALPDCQAIAFGGDGPGLAALFGALVGYTWSPRLPAQGQHALLVSYLLDEGAATAANLCAMLERRARPADLHEGQLIEFVEHNPGGANAQFEDVRTGEHFPPGDAHTNPLVAIAMARLQALHRPAEAGTDDATAAHPETETV